MQKKRGSSGSGVSRAERPRPARARASAPSHSQSEFESDARHAADPDGNAEHARSQGIPAPSDGLPAERSSTGEPAPGIARPSLIDRAGYQNRGAVGYPAAIDRVQQAVAMALAACPELASARLDVLASEGRLVLQGDVEDANQKRLALRVARRAAGAFAIEDGLRVA